MDLDRASILLKKINYLHDSMQSDADQIADIERDLMRQYVRDLYDCYTATAPSQDHYNPGSTRRQPPSNTPKPEWIPPRPIQRPPEPAPQVSLPDPLPEVPAPTAPVARTAAPTPPEPAPSLPKPEPTPTVTPKPPQPQPPIPEKLPRPEPTVPEPTPEPKPTPTPILPKERATRQDPAVEALFEQGPALNDLSSRLSNSRIDNLQRAFSINDRILAINELFKGRQQSFEETVSKLNSFGSYAEAERYLKHDVIPEQQWTDPRREGAARNFIKLVRRRYA